MPRAKRNTSESDVDETTTVSAPAAPAAGLGGEDQYVRVEDRSNPGPEFTILAVHFDDEIYIRLDKPALDNHGEPAAPKYPANLPPAIPAEPTEVPAGDPNSGAPAGDGPAQPGETENGHQAENEGVI